MLELIAIVGGFFLLFYLPYEANKVRNGWVRKRFKGAPEDFPAAYAKALKSFMITGIILGCAGLVLAPLAPEQGEWVFKLLGAAIWFGVAGVAFNQRSKFPPAQPA
ncbi:MAG TPA: hypothetical protein VNV38_15200 [Stellaceae bacterium]|jgi:hypothetical protein|nr:hypothetical protein [Stellaceae bacterium]